MQSETLQPPRSGWVAGLNHGNHDASCALTHEGKLVIWVEQDRLSRIKHAAGQSPAGALMECLNFAGIKLSDLDAVALGSDHAQLCHWLGKDPQRIVEINKLSTHEWLFPKALFGDVGTAMPVVESYSHHMCHAASAFYPSGFASSAALIVDAMGEDTSTSLMVCDDASIRLLKSFGVDDSLGYFYESAAQYAGLGRQDAGKLMGLAGYGRATIKLPLRTPTDLDDRIWDINGVADPRGRFRIEARCQELLRTFSNVAFPFEVGLTGEPMAYRDFAASAQAALEHVLIRLASKLATSSLQRNLVLAGGVALNCSGNGQIAASGLFQQMFVQPASNDSGVALGAALMASKVRYSTSFQPNVMTHAYWGLSEEKSAIRETLLEYGLPFQELTEHEMIERVAQAICARHIVAWHQGRSEIGPRALGARSILGNPCTRSTLVTLNRIKSREVWRPLAPSVCSKDFYTFFDGIPSPFMNIAAHVRPGMVNKIPAVVHFDGTARPQSVEENANPLFHRLLVAIGLLSGVPMVVNTSLNGKNEPVCYRSRDTIRFFLQSQIHLLAIDNFIVLNPHCIAERAPDEL